MNTTNTTTKTIHSLTIGAKTFTRESVRRYTAALVATVTEASQRTEDARAARRAEEATVLEATLAAMLSQRGTTLEAARAEYAALDAAADATHDKVLAYIGAHRAEWDMYNQPEYLALQAAHRAAHASTFSLSGPYGVVELATRAERARSAATAQRLPLGEQTVVSWHHTVALAQRAAAHETATDARCDRSRAYSVRTDIATRQRARRAATASRA